MHSALAGSEWNYARGFNWTAPTTHVATGRLAWGADFFTLVPPAMLAADHVLMQRAVQVARRYPMNANLIFAWLRDARFAAGEAHAAADAPCFLPVEIVARVRREDERRIGNDG